jgi:patatin-like phospholipase/acyl hydrolase
MSEPSGAHAPVEKEQPRRRFRILSLDGGGIRGAYSAAFLAGLEDKLGHPISRSFDLIAGTSTGGIIAVALAMGRTAEDVVKLYEEHGKAIFTRGPRSLLRKALEWPANRILRRIGLDCDELRRPKYDPKALADAAREVLEDKTLEDAEYRLIVPAVRTSLGRPIVFRTPHLPGQDRDRHLKAVDVILATTAAPTYFPPHSIKDPHAPGQYVDGGLWANNPGLLAYLEAVRISEKGLRDEEAQFKADDVMVLSIGTGETPSLLRMDEATAGVLGWARHLLDVMMNSQSQGTVRALRYLLPEDRFSRIDFVHCGAGT